MAIVQRVMRTARGKAYEYSTTRCDLPIRVRATVKRATSAAGSSRSRLESNLKGAWWAALTAPIPTTLLYARSPSVGEGQVLTASGR